MTLQVRGKSVKPEWEAKTIVAIPENVDLETPIRLNGANFEMAEEK